MDGKFGLFSVDEVCKYLGLTRRSIYRLVESGQLSGYKLGKVWRFKQKDVEAYVESRRVSTPRRVFRPEVLIKYFQAPHKYKITKKGQTGWLTRSKTKQSGFRIKYQQISLSNGKPALWVTPRYFARLPKAEQNEWLKFEIKL